MPYSTQTRIGPESTPSIIKQLILATCIASIGCVLLEPLINHLFGVMGPLSFLTLSWRGIEYFYLWQPFTYLFVYGTVGARITLFWLIGLAFNMYILWIMGTNILERVGLKRFLRLYLGSGIIAGIAALAAMRIMGVNVILGGPTASILAILTTWAIINPESELVLFFVIPIKSKWLVVILLAVIFFITLANFDIVDFFFYFTGAAIGYIYPTLAWGYRSPFKQTQEFDSFLRIVVDKAVSLIKPSKPSKGKIFDFKTGKPLDDDEYFMDQMLEKISRSGKNSLTKKEQNRMDSIAKRRHPK